MSYTEEYAIAIYFETLAERKIFRFRKDFKKVVENVCYYNAKEVFCAAVIWNTGNGFRGCGIKLLHFQASIIRRNF